MLILSWDWSIDPGMMWPNPRLRHETYKHTLCQFTKVWNQGRGITSYIRHKRFSFSSEVVWITWRWGQKYHENGRMLVLISHFPCTVTNHQPEVWGYVCQGTEMAQLGHFFKWSIKEFPRDVSLKDQKVLPHIYKELFTSPKHQCTKLYRLTRTVPTNDLNQFYLRVSSCVRKDKTVLLSGNIGICCIQFKEGATFSTLFFIIRFPFQIQKHVFQSYKPPDIRQVYGVIRVPEKIINIYFFSYHFFRFILLLWLPYDFTHRKNTCSPYENVITLILTYSLFKILLKGAY